MIGRFVRLARPYFVMLAIVTVGRWLLGTAFGVPYERGTWYFSIVMLTLFASLFYGVFTRRWLSFRILQAVGLGMVMAVISQLVIWLSTVASYGLGIQSYFNHPFALTRQMEPVAFLPAMGSRAVGLVVNTILTGIAGALGWVLGALLPPRAE
ncbi:MAG: hypothetical protein A2V74_02010 [Acidobacteria bacterium RBG_16_70_10]|nr:MAG: hypothetical protein A2V74_02010 [Acidobacteria bacterium RBG_16_70_10]